MTSVITLLRENRVVTAGIAEAPSPKVDCLPGKDEAEPGRGWIRKKTTEWKLVTNFQYSA